MYLISLIDYKKSLKIPKGYSEDVNQRTDNTMAKRKKVQKTNNDLQNITQKTKDRVTRTPLSVNSILFFQQGILLGPTTFYQHLKEYHEFPYSFFQEVYYI